MKISLVVAASLNNVIGKDNQLLWHLPKDMRFFKNTTWAMPILMGRKTFESLGNKLLPGRWNLVLTRQTHIELHGATAVASMEEALDLAKQKDYKELMIIGGGELYKMALPLAHQIYLTRVHATIEGDTYFPVLDAQWEKSFTQSHPQDEKHAFSFDFEIWQRK